MDEIASIDALLRLVEEAWKVRALSAELERDQLTHYCEDLQNRIAKLVDRVRELEETFVKEKELGHFRPDKVKIGFDVAMKMEHLDMEYVKKMFGAGAISHNEAIKKLGGSTS